AARFGAFQSFSKLVLKALFTIAIHAPDLDARALAGRHVARCGGVIYTVPDAVLVAVDAPGSNLESPLLELIDGLKADAAVGLGVAHGATVEVACATRIALDSHAAIREAGDTCFVLRGPCVVRSLGLAARGAGRIWFD